MLFPNEFQELILTHDLNTKFFCFLKFRGTHVLAGQNEGRLVADTSHILTAILFNNGFVFIAAVVGEHTTDHDTLSL